MSESEQEAKFAKYKERLAAIQEGEKAKLAIIDDERNVYCDNIDWGIFCLPHHIKYQEPLQRIDYCSGPASKGDSVLIKCVVVINDVFVQRMEASVYVPCMAMIWNRYLRKNILTMEIRSEDRLCRIYWGL